jgi:hypothetical protein
MGQYLIDAEAALALVDPRAYAAFVAEKWTPSQLHAHFTRQIQERRLLIWGTGAPGKWRVEVAMKWSDEKGFREVQGTITATGHRLLFANFELLSRLAEFPHSQLADEEPGDMNVALRAGTYRCRIVQLYDPAQAEWAGDGPNTHFLIELEPPDGQLLPDGWQTVPWLEE